MDAQEKKWQTEGDVRTLIEAEKIKADPKRLQPAMEQLDKEMQATMKAGQSSIEDKAKKRFPETYKKKEEK